MAHIGTSRVAAAGQAAEQVGEAAREGARQASPWIVPLARVGYAAKGVVYLVIAWLALKVATGRGGAFANSRSALEWIGQGPVGTVTLGVIGVGLLAFALYSLIAAATGAEQRHDGAKGAALRLGQAGTGIAYGALGVRALMLLANARSAQRGGGDGAEHWTARVLGMPFGRAVVIAIGAGIIAYAVYQMYAAFAKDPRRHFDLSRTSAGTAKAVERLSRFGLAARAVVFALIGWFLVRAALRFDPDQAGGIDESLAALGAQPFGRVILGAVALGLAAYGGYSLAEARWRRMRMA
ncbi:MAG: DUF1206 domain-containing protein [Gemmatimonadaceae bacterium]